MWILGNNQPGQEQT